MIPTNTVRRDLIRPDRAISDVRGAHRPRCELGGADGTSGKLRATNRACRNCRGLNAADSKTRPWIGSSEDTPRFDPCQIRSGDLAALKRGVEQRSFVNLGVRDSAILDIARTNRRLDRPRTGVSQRGQCDGADHRRHYESQYSTPSSSAFHCEPPDCDATESDDFGDREQGPALLWGQAPKQSYRDRNPTTACRASFALGSGP